MNKKFVLLTAGVLLLGMTACQDNKETSANAPVTLDKQERELTNGDPNVAAQLLVRKAVLKEIQNAKLDEKEKFELQFVKDEAAIAYYLQRTVGNGMKVTDEQIEKVYKDNKDKLGGKELKDLRDQIRYAIVNQQQNEKLAEYYNNLVNKYKLNDALKAEFPENKDEAAKK